VLLMDSYMVKQCLKIMRVLYLRRAVRRFNTAYSKRVWYSRRKPSASDTFDQYQSGLVRMKDMLIYCNLC
jgi:hypothetical protein